MSTKTLSAVGMDTGFIVLYTIFLHELFLTAVIAKKIFKHLEYIYLNN